MAPRTKRPSVPDFYVHHGNEEPIGVFLSFGTVDYCGNIAPFDGTAREAAAIAQQVNAGPALIQACLKVLADVREADTDTVMPRSTVEQILWALAEAGVHG